MPKLAEIPSLRLVYDSGWDISISINGAYLRKTNTFGATARQAGRQINKQADSEGARVGNQNDICRPS